MTIFAREMSNYLAYEFEPFLLYMYLLHTFLVILSSLHIRPFSFPPLPTTFFQQEDFSFCYTQQIGNGYKWNWFLTLTYK